MREEDLTVEPQPDANFTLELPGGFLSLGADYEPNGKTENTTYDSDGMLPYDFARHYDADAQLVVGTDYYPETGREVISYLRTSAVGVGTPRGVKVGDSEKALLTEYPEALYCIAADESELYDGYSDEGGYSEPAYDFDRAYVWRPPDAAGRRELRRPRHCVLPEGRHGERDHDDKKAVCVPFCLRCGPRRGAAPCGRKPQRAVRAVKKQNKSEGCLRVLAFYCV